MTPPHDCGTMQTVREGNAWLLEQQTKASVWKVRGTWAGGLVALAEVLENPDSYLRWKYIGRPLEL